MVNMKGGNEIIGGIVIMFIILNKIFVGCKDGWVEFWNVSIVKLIYMILLLLLDCGVVICFELILVLFFFVIVYFFGIFVIKDVLLDK